MSQKLLSTGEVACRLGVARHVLSYALEQRRIPEPRRVSGRRAFSETDLQRIRLFLEERRVPGGVR